MTSNFYQILNLDRSATSKDIERAYKRQALIHHPDRNRDEAATQNFQRILEAYQTLSDPIQRVSYDASLRRPGPLRSTTQPAPSARSPPQPTNPAPPKPTRSSTTPLNRQPPPVVNTDPFHMHTPRHSAYTKTPTTASRPPKQSRTFYANPRAFQAKPDSRSNSFFSTLFTSVPPPPEPKPFKPDTSRRPTKQEIPKFSREEAKGFDPMRALEEMFPELDLGSDEKFQTPAPNLFFTHTDPAPRRDHRSPSVGFDSNIFSFPESPGPKKTTRHTTTDNTSVKSFSYQDPELKQGPRTRSGATSKLDETFQRTSVEGTSRGRTKGDDNWNRRGGHGASSWSTKPDHHVHRRSVSCTRRYVAPSGEVFAVYDDDLYGVNWPPVRPKDPGNCKPADKNQYSGVEQWVRTSSHFRA